MPSLNRPPVRTAPTIDPMTWITIAPGTKVLAPSVIERAPGSSHDTLVKYLRSKFSTNTWEVQRNGQRLRCRTVKQELDHDPSDYNTPDHVYRVVGTVLTRQGVPDLDRANGRGYNGNKWRCQHGTPGLIPTYAKDETYLDPITRKTRHMRATYCTGCDTRLWDDRTAC